MPNDPFFNRIAIQLMHPDDLSRHALDSANSGAAITAPSPELLFPIESAKSWVNELLKPSFHPPEKTAFLAFPMEGGVCDTVRARYRAGRFTIDIAQSQHLLSMRIEGLKFAKETKDVQKAEQIAQEMFVMGDRINLEFVGTFETGTYGKQRITPESRVSADWPHWLDTLRWWCKQDEIGFVTLKALGGPTKGLISPAEDLNIHWFSRTQ